jgi:hypothetical protein
LDAVWALLLSKGGAMMNPYEYREMLKAAFNWTDKTMEQVAAEFDKKKDDKKSSGRAKSSVSSGGAPKKSELSKLDSLLANAKPRPRPDSV